MCDYCSGSSGAGYDFGATSSKTYYTQDNHTTNYKTKSSSLAVIEKKCNPCINCGYCK